MSGPVVPAPHGPGSAAAGPGVPPVEVRRSKRRSRTVGAWREDGRTVVAIPARFTRAQEREWVARMTARLDAADRRRRPSDERLASRAAELSARYLSGRARPSSVAWSSRQGRRWGSCTPSEGTIRLSDRLQGMPVWVIDYVLLHELVHLLHPGHGPEFWAELTSYPHTERARGFLEGVSHAGARPDDAEAAPTEPPGAALGRPGPSQPDPDTDRDRTAAPGRAPRH